MDDNFMSDFVFGNDFEKTRLHEENKLLKDQLVQFTLMNSEMESYLQENIRLKEMLNFKENQPLNFLTANVVGHNFGLPTQSITIDIGRKEGVVNNLTVLDENGLLGKTINIGDHTALAQLITDKNFRVSVRIGTDRALGLFIPTHGKYGILEGVRKTTPLHKGDIVYSSGISDKDTLIVSTIPFNNNLPIPIHDLIDPVLFPPASVIPRCKG